MKRVLITFLFTFIGFSSIFAQEWQTDLSTAKEIAKKEKKPIVLVFQGSDWCGPCIKLDHEVWSTAEFKEYSKDHFVMLKADFPKRNKNALSKEQQDRNNALAEKYNKNGYFPFVVVLNAKGEVKGTTGYKKMAPAQFQKLLSSYN
tara:strand:+ start:36636 stop:37073 length:438 start_codon:yes stop_codon:yes gene_type:complete